MFEAVLLAAALHAPTNDHTPPPARLGHSAEARQWAIQRPSRGAHGSVVRDAAQFPASLRPFAACVLDRESGGSLDRRESGSGARNPASSAQGRWQFLDRLWRPSLADQVAARLRDHGLPRPQVRQTRQWLQAHPIASWPGILQDIGFIEVVSRGGASHWSLPGSRCQGMMPR